MPQIAGFLIVLAVMQGAAFPLFAQKTYTVSQTEAGPPVVDGQLDDPAWRDASWGQGFVQREPDSGEVASQETAFALWQDGRYLYVAVRAYDTDPARLDHRMTRRDTFEEGDQIAVLFDTYADYRTAFVLAVTVAGVRTDAICADDSDDCDTNWDPVWIAQTSVDTTGWAAEIRIPFDQLRFARGAGQEWGLQVGRYVYRNQEWSVWQSMPQEASGYASLFGTLKGLRVGRGRRPLEILPYTVVQGQTFEQEDGNPFATGRSSEVQVGLDGKVGLTSNLTMDVTLNPDFGQVEADPSVVNLTAFETRFEEKRPFFIEGRDILNFQLPGSSAMSDTDLFYSRRIGRVPRHAPFLEPGAHAQRPERTAIRGALKLTGKTQQGVSVGLLNAVTAAETALIEGGDGGRRRELVEPRTHYLVGRIGKDFREGNTVLGGVLTSTRRALSEEHLTFLNRAAYTGGLNVGHQWADKTYFMRLSMAFSHVRGSEEALLGAQRASTRYFQRPDADHLTLDPYRTTLSGHGGSVQGGKGGNGHWVYNLRVNWRSPGLALNDLGFLRQADLIQEKLFVGYRFFKPIGPFRRLEFATEHLARWNFAGERLFQEGYVQAQGQLRSYWGFWTRYYVRGDGLSATALRGGPALRFEGSRELRYRGFSDQRQRLAFEVGGESEWSGDGLSRAHGFGVEATWRPHNTLSLSFNPAYSFAREDLQWVGREGEEEDARYLFGRLHQRELQLVFRLNYSLTPALSLQYYGQPFVSAGAFTQFKRITAPRASAYTDRFHSFTQDELTLSATDNRYTVEEAQDAATYSFQNPDFNVREFRSNLVFRWEYRAGSTVFFVWSQERAGVVPTGEFEAGRDLNQLFSLPSHNVFMIKVSHRFSL